MTLPTDLIASVVVLGGLGLGVGARAQVPWREALVQESQLSFKIRRTFLVHIITEKSLKPLWLKCSKTRRGLFCHAPEK